MKTYTDRSTAPLKFHKFLIWFSLPLGTLLSMANAVQYASANYSSGFYYSLDMGYQILFIALSVLSIIGLWRFRRSGPLLLYARQVLSICYYLLAMLIFNAYDLSISVFSSSLSKAITWLVIFAIYYQKRMPLFTSRDSVSLSEPTAPQQTDQLSFVPPVLYAEPEKIPRKYSGTLYTLTGKTQNDLEVLQSLFKHSDSKVNSIMGRMGKIGNTPGDPERESLARQFLTASHIGQCTAYMIAAIIPTGSTNPRQELFPSQLQNVQFEWDYMCDMIKDLQDYQADLEYLPEGSSRRDILNSKISLLEERISDSQLRIYHLYRM